VGTNILHKTKQIKFGAKNRLKLHSNHNHNSNCSCSQNETLHSSNLDTLAQLDQVAPIGALAGGNAEQKIQQKPSGKDTLLKRARAKFLTQEISRELGDLNSPLKKAYWNTFYCTHILEQVGTKITSKYCKNRFCIVCNRIRTAKLIAEWMPVLKKMDEPVSLVLTIPNCDETLLQSEMKRMKHKFELIRRTFKNNSKPLKALRKLECTYNDTTNLYHPHFHFIIDGYVTSKNVLEQWMKHFPECNIKAQHISRADENSLFELFKYVTKFVSNKSGIHIKALDTIFQAMYNQKTFQAYGLKKQVNEDIETLISEIYSDLENREIAWIWDVTDWIDHSSGECLTGYKPSESMLKLITNIDTS